MAPAPCIECQRRPKHGGKHRCYVCQLRRADIDVQVTASRRRLAMVPEELRVARIPAKHWPAGMRWCAACQSFRELDDFGKGASRCRPCASSASHAATIAKTYGLTPADYAALLSLQGGRCAICRQRPRAKRLAVDHDHKTGAVRGLLCSRCNHDLLGSGFDSVDVLQAGADYLATPPAAGHWSPPETRERRSAAPAAPSAAEPPPAAPSVAAGFAAPSDGRPAPRGADRVALAAALERAAAADKAPVPHVKAALDELDAALEHGKKADLVAAVEGVRAVGLLFAPPF